MSTTRSIDEKIISLDGRNSHRPIVLNMLAEVLANEGLKDVAIADLTPGVKTNLSTLIEDLKSKGGWIGNLLLIVLPTDDGQKFNKIQGRFRDEPAELYDKYSVDWVDMLRGEKNLRAKNINSAVTNSSRVLIAEIFDRLIFQALREDSKLPPGKNRGVWVAVMRKFTSKLLDENQLQSAELDVSFRGILSQLLDRWTGRLTLITKRLEDLNLADTIINEHTRILEEQKLQGMRFIVAQLAGIENANNNWSGKLNRLAGVKSNLALWEKKWIERMKIGGESPRDLKVLIVSKDSKKLSGENKWQLSYEEKDYGYFDEIDSEKQGQIIRQKIICSNDEKGYLKKLYAWMSFHTLVLNMVKHVGEMYRLGGWIPLFMETFNLDEIDRLVEMTTGIFNSLVRLEMIVDLSGTTIYKEIETPNASIIDVPLDPLHTFKTLGSDKLLLDIRNEFVHIVKALMDDGDSLGCNIVSDKHIGILGKFLEPSQKQALESHRKRTSNLTVEDVTDKEASAVVSVSSGAPSIASGSSVVGTNDVNSKERKLLKMRMFEMKVEYIIEFFRERESLDMISDLYDRHKNGERLDFILKFGRDDEFDNATPFVNEIKNIIRIFEAKVNLSDEKSQTDLKLWAERLEEVFCLKFLCMESIRIKNQGRLIHFCDEMELHSNKSFRYWFFKSPKRYDKLLVAINPLLLDAKAEDRISDGELDLVLYQKENEELKKEITLAKSENSILRANLIEKDEVISGNEKEILENKSQISDAKLGEKKAKEERHAMEGQLFNVLAAQKNYLEGLEEKRIADQKSAEERRIADLKIAEEKRIIDEKIMKEQFEEKRKIDMEDVKSSLNASVKAIYEMMQKETEAKLQAQRVELEEKSKIDINKAKTNLTVEFDSQRAGYLHTINALQMLVGNPLKESEDQSKKTSEKSSSSSVVPVGVFAANPLSRSIVTAEEISPKAKTDQKLSSTGTFG